MEKNDITYQIRGAAFRLHTKLGPGLLESVYEAALKYELEKAGLKVQSQAGIPMVYEEIKFDLGFRLDLLVEESIIVEIKSVEALNEVHFKQVMTYLREITLRILRETIYTCLFQKYLSRHPYLQTPVILHFNLHGIHQVHPFVFSLYDLGRKFRF